MRSMIHSLVARIRKQAVGRMGLGHRMILEPAVPEQRHALKSGEYETRTVMDCLRLVPSDGVFLDIGANVGFFTCAFAAVDGWFNGRIHAFEPVASNFQRLKRNIALNNLGGRVRAYRTALGDAPGAMKIHIVPGGRVNNAVGERMLSEVDREKIAREAWRTESVPVVRLDDWAAAERLDRCDLIKIDIEGAEYFALAGGIDTIRRHRPAILGEFSPYWMRGAGKSFADVDALLAPLGYRPFIFNGDDYEPPTEANAPGDDDTPAYLLLPEEKLELLDRLIYE